MDIAKEVALLKYQFSLMKHMIQSDEYPFFMFAIDHEFEEAQVNALLKILLVFGDRLGHQEISILAQSNDLFARFNIPLDRLYSPEQPTLGELKLYISKVFYQEFELKYLLLSLKKQHISIQVCNYLLEQL